MATSGGGGFGGGGTEQEGKKTHGKQSGDSWGEGTIRGPNNNGKNTIKIKFLKTCFCITYVTW